MQPLSKSPVAASAPLRSWPIRAFAVLYGGFLGLALLKFGNPVIMEKWVGSPADFLHAESQGTPPKVDVFEVLLSYPWPIAWAFSVLIGLGMVLICILVLTRQPIPLRPAVGPISSIKNRGTGEAESTHKPLVSRAVTVIAVRIVLLLPLIWFAWQLAAAAASVDVQLSRLTLGHFAACIGCFYVGWAVLGGLTQPGSFWSGIFIGLVVVLAYGWPQHFGGLEETRRYFYMYIYPHMTEPPPPEYLKRISSNRIFATLFYPNALAGALLLLLPPLLGVFGTTKWLTFGAKAFLIGLLTAAALPCLYWSGSKGGWLIMLLLGLLALFRAPIPKQFKTVLTILVLIGGMAGFVWKYSSFFQKGATSVSARFDYWRAAIQTALEHPLLGTGPGTFAIPYGKIKRPESEMSRIVHNDYLEQASDSGFPGFLMYTAWIFGGVALGFRGLWRFREPDLKQTKSAIAPQDWLRFTVWLGLVGFGLQSFLEFPLYIPALSWVAFTFMGWLVANTPVALIAVSKAKALDKSPTPGLASPGKR